MPQTAAAKAAFRQHLIRSVVTPIALMSILAVALIAQVSQLMRATRWVEHTDQVISELYRMKTAIVDAQASVRAYMLSGFDEDLASFRAAEAQVPEFVRTMRSETADRSETAAYIDEIETQRAIWSQYSKMRVETRKATGKIPEIVRDSPGRIANERMRAAIDHWIDEEHQLRGERNAVTKRWALATMIGAGGLTLGLGAVLALLARGQLRWLSKTYEAALTQSRELRESLERRVDERTRELQVSNGALNEANKELEAFAYSVSHDLRAPMRHISGFANLLKLSNDAKLTADDTENLDTIHRTAVQAGRMVDDLLAFSRIGRTQMRFDPVDLDPIVTLGIQELAPEIAGRKVEWNVAKLPKALGDAALLRLVFQNLLSNAVKYTGTREAAHIEVGSRNETDGTTYFVKDDGVGFDMAYGHKLFGVFQRLHRAEEFEGTGIGLANVRRIIARHGGRTWAEGTPGVGATFFFFLPDAATRASAISTSSETSETST